MKVVPLRLQPGSALLQALAVIARGGQEISQGTQLFRKQPPCLTTLNTAIHKNACPRPFV